MRRYLISLARISILAIDRMGWLRSCPANRSPCPPDRVSNIIVWTMDRIGDVQRATPILRQLRHRYPEARIDVVVAARAAQILNNNPYISNLHVIGSPYDFKGHRQVLRALDATPWDIGVLAEVDRCWAKLGRWSFRRLDVRNWGEFDLGNCPDNRAVPVPLGHGSWTDQFVALAHALDAPPVNANDLDLFVTVDEQQDIRSTLDAYGIDTKRPFFVVHPGGGEQVIERQWPPSAYAELVDTLAYRWGWPILITGSQNEAGIARDIQARASGPSTDLCGKLSLRQLAALLSECSLCIMNDTGPLHMAHALDRPTVAILGPTAAEVVGIPETSRAAFTGLDCQPCAFLKDWKRCTNPETFACLTRLSVDAVVEVVETRVALFEQTSNAK